MSLVPYRKNNWLADPLRELENLHREMNRLFDFSLTNNPFGETTLMDSQWSPAIDIHESKDNLLVKADLPGFKKEEIEIAVQENNLIMKGEKKKEQEVKEENYYKSERFYGSFYRTIQLPALVDEAKVDAQYKDGVLILTLPKREEAKPKQIKVNIK